MAPEPARTPPASCSGTESAIWTHFRRHPSQGGRVHGRKALRFDRTRARTSLADSGHHVVVLVAPSAGHCALLLPTRRATGLPPPIRRGWLLALCVQIRSRSKLVSPDSEVALCLRRRRGDVSATLGTSLGFAPGRPTARGAFRDAGRASLGRQRAARARHQTAPRARTDALPFARARPHAPTRLERVCARRPHSRHVCVPPAPSRPRARRVQAPARPPTRTRARRPRARPSGPALASAYAPAARILRARRNAAPKRDLALAKWIGGVPPTRAAGVAARSGPGASP